MKVHTKIFKAFGALLIAALLFGAIPAGEVKANDIPSSTIVFESVDGYTLTDNEDGTYSGVLPVIDDGGFDIYAREGFDAFLDGIYQTIGADHDAWPTWTPDTPDWYQYSLHLYEESGVQKWALRNHAGATAADPWYVASVEPMGVPMSGTMHWGTMYAEETDVGAYLPGTGTAESAGLAETEGGGAGYWDMDWSWGSEAVPLEYPGFDVSIVDLGSGDYRVTFTPAEGPVKNITSGNTYATIQAAIDDASDGDTIEVGPGTYIEGSSEDSYALEINVPNLIVRSAAGRDVTTVDAGGAESGVWVLKNLGDVTSDGFTVENFAENGIVQSYSQREGTAFHILNNFADPSNGYLRNGLQVSGEGSSVIGNIVYGAPLTDDWASTGIGVINASNVVVKENTVQQDVEEATNPDIGINVMNYSALASNVTIENNTVTNAGNGVRISAGNSTYIVQNVTIKNNLLEENNKGINVQTVALDGVTITGNTIRNSYDVIDGEDTEFGMGIRFSDESATVTNAFISGNTFSDNETYQVFGHVGALIDVPGVLSTNTFDKAVVIEGKPVIYSTIQGAIDAASDGDTILVSPGIYDEALELRTPNITVESTAGRDVTILDVPDGNLTTGVKLLADMGTVTFDGFTVKDFTESGIIQGMSIERVIS